MISKAFSATYENIFRTKQTLPSDSLLSTICPTIYSAKKYLGNFLIF